MTEKARIRIKLAEDITAGDMILMPGGKPFRVDLITALGPNAALAWSGNSSFTLIYGKEIEYLR